jgi:penicillin V acylase-like amidase (Ntn superfamily)
LGTIPCTHTAGGRAARRRYYFESTYAPNVVWVDFGKLDFSKGTQERELQVEKKIFSLSGESPTYSSRRNHSCSA